MSHDHKYLSERLEKSSFFTEKTLTNSFPIILKTFYKM